MVHLIRQSDLEPGRNPLVHLEVFLCTVEGAGTLTVENFPEGAQCEQNNRQKFSVQTKSLICLGPRGRHIMDQLMSRFGEEST